MHHKILLLFLCLLLLNCNKGEEKTAAKANARFVLLDSAATGIDFSNTLSYDNEFNVYTYRNYYNGGGVAIGDINNDGLPDIYFTANQIEKGLYLNQGFFF
mgnify:CR=1 FL=1